jgi:hypothetical protein
MALGILGAMSVVGPVEDHLFIGELSLDGAIRPVRGALLIPACARRNRPDPASPSLRVARYPPGGNRIQLAGIGLSDGTSSQRGKGCE